MKPLPTIAIVGRPNVGKSELFNRIAGRKIALVFDRPGVTRDRIVADCMRNDIHFQLIDTGGIFLNDESGFEKAIQREVDIALEAADDIFFVVDGREGIHPLDLDIARKLRRSKKRIWLLVNKMDTPKQEGLENLFARLGFERIFPISAAHGRGVGELLEQVQNYWEVVSSQEEVPPATVLKQSTRVGILGRPNVGKSSLVNALLSEDRLIVSPIAGTTRDAVDVEFTYHGRKYTLIDTAGMRKRSRVADPLEQAMTGRSAHVIDRAHLCLLVVDALAGVGEQEKKIAGLIQKAHKPCIVVINKWDLAAKAFSGQREQKQSLEQFIRSYQEAVLEQLFFLSYAHVVLVSAQKKQNLAKLLQALEEVEMNRTVSIGTGVLNRILQRALERQPPPRKQGKFFKIYYATQIEGEVPTFNVFVNNTSLLTDAYQRYMEQQLRKEHPYAGCPVVWLYKNKPKSSRTRSPSKG